MPQTLTVLSMTIIIKSPSRFLSNIHSWPKTAFVMMALVLSACSDDPAPQVTAPQVKAPEVKVSEVTASVAEETEEVKAAEPATEENTAEALSSSPKLSITLPENTDEEEAEQTIQSIIDQLNQLDSKPTSGQTKANATVDQNPSTVIWSLETNNPAADENAEEKSVEVIIPEGKDPSLAADALAAAFALVRASTDLDEQLMQDKSAPMIKVKKPSNGVRAAVLMPLDGPAQNIGEDMRKGAELAIFTLNNKGVDVTFHDTSSSVNQAMMDAISQNADMVIGPLFASNTTAVKTMAEFADIPIISFSNDSSITASGTWLIGQTPEQEIERVLWHALSTLKPIPDSERSQLSIAIIAQDNEYGERISQHSIAVMRDHGGLTAQLLTLSQDVLDDEKALRQSIKNMTNWLPPASDGSTRTPDFDIVLIAGDAGFSLRVAPVLNWYDLDPEKVQYLGTSTWDNPAILQEPSLMGGWYANLPSSRVKAFDKIWSQAHDNRASKYAVMAFDVVALVSTLDASSPTELRNALMTQKGFRGFSGLFRFNADGHTNRLLEIRQVSSNGYDVLNKAPSQF